MSHQDPLCPCCRLRQIYSRLPVCTDCELHQGNTGTKLQRRNDDHVRAWSKARSVLTAQTRRATERLVKELDEARIELEQRPVRIVRENLDAETVEKAVSDRDIAYRSRDIAMQALCRVRLLHRERAPSECSCGRNYSKCQTAQIVQEYEALANWEAKQITRMRQNLNHYLPDNHPAILDRRSAW
jgi:hypothetical protein